MKTEDEPEEAKMKDQEEAETDTAKEIPPGIVAAISEMVRASRPERTLGASIAQVFNFLGGISGLFALVGIVFWGGGLVEKVKSLDGRVTAIEGGGSQTFKMHASAD